MNTSTTRGTQVIELLGLLSSEEEQLKYEEDVPHVDITTELLFMWFDDQYHPALRHFENCFTAEELQALREFDRLYDEWTAQLPDSEATVATWHRSPVWQEIMQKARDTLEELGD
jgi:hypothetical protein